MTSSLVSEARLKEIRRPFNESNINVSNEWLVDSLKALNGLNNNTISGKHLLQRWLNTDLRKVKMNPPFLPLKDIQDYNSHTLEGNFVVQINEMKDVSVPASLLKSDLINLEDEDEHENDDETDQLYKSSKRKPSEKKINKTKSPRLLMFQLTDGCNQFKAIEYSTIEKLNLETPLGCKLLLKGPIEVSFMVLLLMESNIEVLGGEVKTLREEVRPEPTNQCLIDSTNALRNPVQETECPQILNQVKLSDKIGKSIDRPSQPETTRNIKVIDLTVSASEDNLLVDDLDDDIFIS